MPYGGDHVTGDLAYGLSTSRQHAERIKNLFGSTSSAAATTAPGSSSPLLGDHADLPTGEVPRTRVTEIVRARVEEILHLAQAACDEHAELLAARPPRSIVLTGGGSQLEGIEELVQEMFRLPTRCGRPGPSRRRTAWRMPCCATAAGAVGLASATMAAWAGATRSRSRSSRTGLLDWANGLGRTSERSFSNRRPVLAPGRRASARTEHGRPICGGET